MVPPCESALRPKRKMLIVQASQIETIRFVKLFWIAIHLQIANITEAVKLVCSTRGLTAIVQ